MSMGMDGALCFGGGGGVGGVCPATSAGGRAVPLGPVSAESFAGALGPGPGWFAASARGGNGGATPGFIAGFGPTPGSVPPLLTFVVAGAGFGSSC